MLADDVCLTRSLPTVHLALLPAPGAPGPIVGGAGHCQLPCSRHLGMSIPGTQFPVGKAAGLIWRLGWVSEHLLEMMDATCCSQSPRLLAPGTARRLPSRAEQQEARAAGHRPCFIHLKKTKRS